jgi:hypothetical protein
VTRAARWEWAFATEAIARGDLLLLLDDEAAAEHPVDPGDRLWLLPSWRSQSPDAVKRSWWPEITRSHRARAGDGTVPLRCLCEIVTTHSLDEEARRRVAPFHPWSPQGASSARRALLVRAQARPEPLTLPRPEREDASPAEREGASRAEREGASPAEREGASYIELATDPPPEGLLPALTDEAFALHRAPLERQLEAADAPGR